MMNGLDFSSKIKQAFAQIPVIIMTAHADVQSAVDSYQSGAFDYLPKPFELDELLSDARRIEDNVRQMFEMSKNLLPPPDAEFEVDEGDPMIG